MTRRLAVALGLLTVSTVADAQPVRQIVPPGYIAIRVRLGAEEGSGPVNPGGEGPGVPGMPPGLGGGRPGGQFPPPGGPMPMGPGAGTPGTGTPGAGGTTEKSIVVTIQHKGIIKRLVNPEKRFNKDTNPDWQPVVRTDSGETLLLWDSPPFQGYQINLPTLADELKKKHDKDVMPAGARRNELMFDLIRQAVEQNLLDQAVAYTKELIKWTEAKDAKSDALPARLEAYLKAFKAVEPKFDQPLAPPADIAKWQQRLNKAPNVASSHHYALINYGAQFASDDAINRRLTALERNFKAFYLLHALHGNALPLPERQLLVVLVPKSSDLTAYHDKLDGGPIASDAFYAPLHNILVLSPDRTDEMALSFLRSAKDHYKDGWDRNQLLKGKAPAVDATTTPTEVARMMTYALVDLALEEEGITAAVTREGSRQLYATAGILPKYVVLPDWVEFGLSALLQKPKDPGIVTVAGKPSLTLGLGAGYGAANYVLLRQFREFHAAGDLPAADVLLMRVITDKYFDGWRNEQDLDQKIGIPVLGGPATGIPGMPPGQPGMEGGPMNPGVQPGRPGIVPPGAPQPGGPGGRPGRPGGSGSLGGNPEHAQQGPPPGGFGGGRPGGPGPIMPGVPGGPGFPNQPGGGVIDNSPPPTSVREAKAHATAWALVYYLSRTQDKKWMEFVKRLDRMPRDMKLDKTLVLREF